MDKPQDGAKMRFQQYEAEVRGGLSFTEDRFNNGCRALKFDGTGYLLIKNSENLHLQSFTLAVWLKTNKQWLPLICKGTTVTEGNNSPAYRVELTSVTSSYNFQSTKLIGNVSQQFPQNTWFHLAVVVKRNGDMSIYIDGVKKYHYSVGNPIFHNNELLEIGRDVPGITDYFQGVMDDFRLYDYSLSDKEIEQLYRIRPASDKMNSACAELSPAPIPAPINVNLTGITPDISQKPADIFIDLTELTPEDKKEENNRTDITVKIDTADVVMLDSITVKVGETVVLKNIQFYQGKAKVLPSSLPTLEKIYEIMRKYPTMEIELHGHTDNVGDENKNLKLSEERVKAIKKYLVDRKIEPHRIQTKYFGSSRPIADNSSEYTRRLNRRVEVVILKK